MAPSSSPPDMCVFDNVCVCAAPVPRAHTERVGERDEREKEKERREREKEKRERDNHKRQTKSDKTK